MHTTRALLMKQVTKRAHIKVQRQDSELLHRQNDVYKPEGDLGRIWKVNSCNIE